MKRAFVIADEAAIIPGRECLQLTYALSRAFRRHLVDRGCPESEIAAMEGGDRLPRGRRTAFSPSGAPLPRIVLRQGTETEAVEAIVEKTDEHGRTSRLVKKSERNKTPGAFQVSVGDVEQYYERN